MNRTTKGAAIALSVAALFTARLAGAASHEGKPDPAKQDAKVKCSGVNACAGKGACAHKGNACAGKNACKGKGIVEMSADECKAKGGKAE
jgi:hypothetical protein